MGNRTNGTCQPSPAASAAVSQGVVFVAAAGNLPDNPNDYIPCPADAFNVTTVGAIDDNNTESIYDDYLWTNSSRGPTGDGRSKPDVVALGVNIMSTDASTGGYSNFNGTSAATPHVAGVAALIFDANPWWIRNPQYYWVVKHIITRSARLNDELQTLTKNDRGYGIVDAERAVTYVEKGWRWDPLFQGLLGPGNSGFENRTIFTPGVSGEPYWSASSGGWRDVKGDVNSDKICDSSDLYAVANAYGSQPCDPNWDSDCDLNGDRIVDISDLYTVGLDYGKEVNCKDGSYSWYTSGSGGYNMTQWLCNNDVNYLKGKEATFSFWFKQHETGNNAMAKITYVTETGQQTISGSPVYATEGWHNTTVTTTLPANTVAIKVIINLTDDHATWIDKATIETS